jgi:hypothetical protein
MTTNEARDLVVINEKRFATSACSSRQHELPRRWARTDEKVSPQPCRPNRPRRRTSDPAGPGPEGIRRLSGPGESYSEVILRLAKSSP